MSAARANRARATLAEHDPVPVSTKAGLQPRGRQMLAVTDRCTTEHSATRTSAYPVDHQDGLALTPTPPSLSGKARHPRTARLVTTVLTSTQERTPQQCRATRGIRALGINLAVGRRSAGRWKPRVELDRRGAVTSIGKVAALCHRQMRTLRCHVSPDRCRYSPT